MQAQGIANVIESDRVAELGKKQRDDVTPGTERAGFTPHAGFTRQCGNEELGNQIANLPKKIELRWSWRVCSLLFFTPAVWQG